MTKCKIPFVLALLLYSPLPVTCETKQPGSSALLLSYFRDDFGVNLGLFRGVLVLWLVSVFSCVSIAVHGSGRTGNGYPKETDTRVLYRAQRKIRTKSFGLVTVVKRSKL